ncbi:MAG: LysR family transcriptional regulator [Thermodesulfobacteriota bacterium]
MELRQLKTFYTVAQLSSFNKAAETLHYAQSTISAQIRLLEEEFGRPLFDRLGKSIVLTAAGEVLLRYARKMLDMEAETLTQMAGREEPRGSITLRVPQSLSSYALPPVLKQFRDRYPRVGLDINSCALTIQQELRSGVIDLAFLLIDSIQERDLIAEVLAFEKLLLICGVGHPLAQQPSLGIRELSAQTILLPKQDCSYKMLLERMLTEEAVDYAALMEFNSIEAIKRSVREGVGITLIPEMAVRSEIESGELMALPWSEGVLETAVLMIRHKEKWLSPALRDFMTLVREHFHLHHDNI